MNDLLKRLDEYTAEGCDWNDTDWLIKSSYRYANVPEPSQLHCLAYALAKQIERLEALLAELEKPYVPMTDDETSQTMQDWYNDTSDETHLSRFIEAAVIARYNQQRGVK